MKPKHIFLTILYFFVLNLSVAFAIESVRNRPVAFLPKTEFSISSVPEGTVIEHDFVIENRGDADLEIYNVSGG